MGDVMDLIEEKANLLKKKKRSKIQRKKAAEKDSEEFYREIYEGLDKAKGSKDGGFMVFINTGKVPDDDPEADGHEVVCAIHKLGPEEISSMMASVLHSHPEVAVHLEAQMKLHAMGKQMPWMKR